MRFLTALILFLPLLSHAVTFSVLDKKTNEIKYTLSQTKEIKNEFIHYTLLSSNGPAKYTYILDTNYNTLSWTVNDPINNHQYTGERVNDTIQIDGILSGGPVNKTIEISDAPLFVNPKIGLSAFSKKDSNEDPLLFWVLKPDDLKPYKMEAIHKGTSTVTINNNEIEVNEVYWSLTGFKKRFYNETYSYLKNGQYAYAELKNGTIDQLNL